MKELLERMRRDFQHEDYRYAYVEPHLNAFIAAQIKVLREARRMNQQQLADAIGTKQSGISRLENCNYDSWKVDTLRKLARAFGVRLRITFEEFGTLPLEVATFRPETLARRKFEEDPVFAPEKKRARRKLPGRDVRKKPQRAGAPSRAARSDRVSIGRGGSARAGVRP